MLKYVAENDYLSFMGVDNMPDKFKFDYLNIRASNYINSKTFGRIDSANVPEEVKYVTCLIMKLLEEKENKISEIGILKSTNIEGWSETYMTSDELDKEYETKMNSLIVEYLYNLIGTDGNPLLYCGV